MKQNLSQQEIDKYFEMGGKTARSPVELVGASVDFRSLGRIAQSRLNPLRFLHERFIRGLTSSLSVYLRSAVSVSLISVEQIQYGEFVDSLDPLTCVAYLNMHPYEGQAIVEINPLLISVILDLMLGGTGKVGKEPARELTELEADLLDPVFMMVTRELTEAWKPVGPIGFDVDALETKPQSSRRINSSEAVVAIAMEIAIREERGLLNLAIPSSALKMVCQRIDQQSAVRKSGSKEMELAIKRRFAKELKLNVKCELRGTGIQLRDLMCMKPGDVLDLGAAHNGRVTISVGDIPKFMGELVQVDSRIAVAIDSLEVVDPGRGTN